MKNLKYTLVILVSLITVSNTFAQTKDEKKQAKQAAIAKMVNAQKYTFLAQYANPQGGGHRYLTSDYDLKIRQDSVIAYLPYFGRAYFDVPYGSTDNGIKFTSTKFTYKATTKKNGGWNVVIKPTDVKYFTQINLFISPDGYANAQFNITNRSAISFDGVLKEK